MRTTIIRAVGAGALIVATTLTGCSFSASKTINQSELEAKTAQALQPKFNETITAHCKGGLKAKVGETQECAITAGGKWQLVTAKATDDNGKFHVNTVPGIVPQPEWAK